MSSQLRFWLNVLMPQTAAEYPDEGQHESGMTVWRAIAIMVVFFAGQFAAAYVIFMFMPSQGGGYSTSQIAVGVVLAVLISGVATLALAARILGDDLARRAHDAAAWARGSTPNLLLGALIGALLAICVAVPITLRFVQPNGPDLPLLLRMAYTPGVPATLFALLSLVLSPPIEELIFRGVFFGGLCKVVSPVVSGVVVTLVFVASHYSVILWRWPLAIPVTLMAIAALVFRMHARAIGPSIAVHFSYNAALIAATYFLTVSS